MGILGCPSNEGLCREDTQCQECQRCVVQKGVGVCVWGKADLRDPSRTVPYVNLQPSGQTLVSNNRTRGEHFGIQVDICGASEGVETRLQVPGGEKRPWACAKQETGYGDGQRQRLECLPTTSEAGEHLFEVRAHGAEGDTEEYLAWTYDTIPPNIIHTHLEEGKRDWKPNEVLYVQLENVDSDINWEGCKVSVDGGYQQYAATYTSCPPGLPNKPNAACFGVLLSELSNLTHGQNYALKLEVQLVDVLGNKAQQSLKEMSVPISRVLWTFSGEQRVSNSSAYAAVVSSSGLAIMQYSATEMVALDVKNAGNEPVWRASSGASQWSEGATLLGMHRGKLVLVKACEIGAAFGLVAFDVQTGKRLTPECFAAAEGKRTAVALLQGGLSQDLMLVQAIEGSNLQLAVYRLNERGESFEHIDSTEPGFHRENFVSDGTDLTIVVQPSQTEGDATLYVSTSSNEWRSFQWKASQGFEDAVLDESLFDLTGLSQEALLIEGGDRLYVENRFVKVLDSASVVRWEMELPGEFVRATGRPLALVSISSKYSVVIVAAEKEGGGIIYGGILIDFPGLKQNATSWPMWGHDLCRSFNLGVPIGSCWDGTEPRRSLLL